QQSVLLQRTFNIQHHPSLPLLSILSYFPTSLLGNWKNLFFPIPIFLRLLILAMSTTSYANARHLNNR
ncbi:hypothetical protein, partial [Nostoc sp.]|uniref:hypothetical protein n=1 Tax=Nostoc sp. TaxID=1180 RepID=UPI002FFA829D